MQYISTRGNCPSVSSAQAILRGQAPDGGLYVPESIPHIAAEDWERLRKADYPARAAYILSLYLTDFTYSDLLAAAQIAYSEEKFGTANPAPVQNLNRYTNDSFILELWHGPTSAFKDMALQLLPHLISLSARAVGCEDRFCLLTATSGDTGAAALSGFAAQAGVSVMVYFPDNGVSAIQQRQMTTINAENARVYAVNANFDEVQSEVKKIFADPELAAELRERGIRLTSANSINWGRLVSQIVYYCSAWLDMLNNEWLEPEETFNVVVPTGNFGNILAAWYAKQMGVPIRQFICASNRNSVLADFFNHGEYNINRPFHTTTSPSMDILISSNLERLLFELTDRDSEKINDWQERLRGKQSYRVDARTLRALKREFRGGSADNRATHKAITDFYDTFDHVIDPHTAVGYSVARRNMSKKSADKFLYVATASPFKFPRTVGHAVLERDRRPDDREGDFAYFEPLAVESGLEIPPNLVGLRDRPEIHDSVIQPAEIAATVREFLL